ncbi:MAG TPA: G1 family glutamic endopeptidase [Gemmataceae bacterium]
MKGTIAATFIEPTFRVTKIRHRPRSRAGAETSDNWSGAVAYRPGNDTNNPIMDVSGKWTVPSVTSPDGGTPPIVGFRCSNWIGIDGDGSSDLVQAGVECDLFSDGPSTFPWFEWLPYDPTEIEIMGMPVSPGDVVFCSISITHTDSPSVPHNDTATIFLQNTTTSKIVSFAISSPANQHLVGNCAEWIVERPIVGTTLTQLPNYGSVTFQGCLTGSADWGGEPGLASTNANSINMHDDTRTRTISEGSIPAVATVTCNFTG